MPYEVRRVKETRKISRRNPETLKWESYEVEEWVDRSFEVPEKTEGDD